MDNSLSTPILFLAFNRPEKTKRVFEVIRHAKPQILYVAVDAPRADHPEDIENVAAVKKIVTNVDWDCTPHYLFQDKNLGCTLAGKTAWDWLFAQEDRMIFIEDDGLATPSFFYYCQELLDRYKDDSRIAYIGGVNYQVQKGSASYYATHLSVPTYGMATWKRVYKLYDYELESYPKVRNSKSFRSHFVNRFERDWFIDSYDRYYDSVQRGRKENTYDKQMSYLIWRYNMFCLHPNKNLVSNIGFDFDGTNTALSPDSWLAHFFGRPAEEIDSIIHLDDISTTNTFEKRMFKAKVLLHRDYFVSYVKFYLYRFYRKNIRPYLHRND